MRHGEDTMQIRWLLLAISTLITWLALVHWLVTSPGARWLELPILGLGLAAAVAGVMLIAGSRRRWPAALVVLGVAPMMQVTLTTHTVRFAVVIGGATAVIVFGTLATGLAAVAVLVAKPPPPPPEPIARAMAVRSTPISGVVL